MTDKECRDMLLELEQLKSRWKEMQEIGYTGAGERYNDREFGSDSAWFIAKHFDHIYDVLSTQSNQVESAHPDDLAVDRFANEMKLKLAAARNKGRGGWETCTQDELGRMLRGHVEKGDPIDVANFCMFLSALGYGIAPQQTTDKYSLELPDGLMQQSPKTNSIVTSKTMTRSDVIRMAQKCNFEEMGADLWGASGDGAMTTYALERFAALCLKHYGEK